MQPSVRIERIGKPEQVALVRAPPVVEDQEAVRLTLGSALQIDERLGNDGPNSPLRRRSC
jgi:hypothetical protein